MALGIVGEVDSKRVEGPALVPERFQLIVVHVIPQSVCGEDYDVSALEGVFVQHQGVVYAVSVGAQLVGQVEALLGGFGLPDDSVFAQNDVPAVPYVAGLEDRHVVLANDCTQRDCAAALLHAGVLESVFLQPFR